VQTEPSTIPFFLLENLSNVLVYYRELGKIDGERGFMDGHTTYGNRPRIDIKPKIWTDNITKETIPSSV